MSLLGDMSSRRAIHRNSIGIRPKNALIQVKELASRSWRQGIGAKDLAPRIWHQGSGTKDLANSRHPQTPSSASRDGAAESGTHP
jgi:hypothetical protein